MYSPRIRNDLIPLLYRVAKNEGKPMTRLVDEILRPEIERRVQQLNQSINPPDPTPFPKVSIRTSLKKTPYER
jgi:hypothetical protein